MRKIFGLRGRKEARQVDFQIICVGRKKGDTFLEGRMIIWIIVWNSMLFFFDVRFGGFDELRCHLIQNFGWFSPEDESNSEPWVDEHAIFVTSLGGGKVRAQGGVIARKSGISPYHVKVHQKQSEPPHPPQLGLEEGERPLCGRVVWITFLESFPRTQKRSQDRWYLHGIVKLQPLNFSDVE